MKRAILQVGGAMLIILGLLSVLALLFAVENPRWSFELMMLTSFVVIGVGFWLFRLGDPPSK